MWPYSRALWKARLQLVDVATSSPGLRPPCMAGCRRIRTCRNMLSGCDGQPTCFRNILPHLNPSLAQPLPQGKTSGDSFPLGAVGAAGSDSRLPSHCFTHRHRRARSLGTASRCVRWARRACRLTPSYRASRSSAAARRRWRRGPAAWSWRRCSPTPTARASSWRPASTTASGAQTPDQIFIVDMQSESAVQSAFSQGLRRVRQGLRAFAFRVANTLL